MLAKSPKYVVFDCLPFDCISALPSMMTHVSWSVGGNYFKKCPSANMLAKAHFSVKSRLLSDVASESGTDGNS